MLASDCQVISTKYLGIMDNIVISTEWAQFYSIVFRCLIYGTDDDHFQASAELKNHIHSLENILSLAWKIFSSQFCVKRQTWERAA